jgi:uncharacterized DUF497 family protein
MPPLFFATAFELDPLSLAVALNHMRIMFDPAKNGWNLAERGLSFERVADLDWATAQIVEDTRRDYSERRFQVTAFLGGRLHRAVFTPREDGLHVISFRKANKREATAYAENQDKT